MACVRDHRLEELQGGGEGAADRRLRWLDLVVDIWECRNSIRKTRSSFDVAWAICMIEANDAGQFQPQWHA